MAPITSTSFGDASNSAVVRLDAIDDVMPPPRVAKIAPHTNATMMSHHGSGSKRSAHRMKKRYVSTSGVTNMTPRNKPTSIAKNVAGYGVSGNAAGAGSFTLPGAKAPAIAVYVTLSSTRRSCWTYRYEPPGSSRSAGADSFAPTE